MSFDLFTLTSGMTPEGIGKALKQFDARNNAVVWLGIDSLTNGVSGHSYDVVFEKMARGVAGWGGRWIPFHSQTGTWLEVDTYKSGFSLVDALNFQDDRKKYSLEGKGAYAATSGNVTFQVTPEFNWAYCDVYYLQQPGGASFAIDRPISGASIDVDSDGTLGIGSQRITNFLLDGETSDSAYASGANSVRVRNAALDGDLTIYGIMFYSGSGGPCFINAATGGMTAENFDKLDDAFQAEWMSRLGVNHAILNAGMNDGLSGNTNEVFETAMSSILGKFPERTTTIIVRPNDNDQDDITGYDSIYSDLADASLYRTLFNLKTEYGDYDYFNDNGWMLDLVHPNLHFQRRFAQDMCRLIFGAALYEDTPAVIDYVADDTQ
jgi:hypothetical protein